MKKIIPIVLLFLFSLSPSTFAHSHLASSTPAEGEIITKALEQITLTFDGKVEQGSTFDLLGPNGQPVSIEEITVTDTEIIGTIQNDWVNGNYQVVWSIISADGHQMEGEYSFEVNIAETETPTTDSNEKERMTENGEESEENTNDATNQDVEQNTDTVEDNTTINQTEEGKSSNLIPIIVVVFVLAIIIIFIALRRKK